MRRRLGVFPLLFLPAFATVVVAGEARKVTYEDDVLPIFRDNCLKCHNPDKLKGDLDLTSFSGVVKGGGSGATLNPGDPDGSQLFKSITHVDEPTMPPNAKLNERDIGTIRAWIEGGLLQGQGSRQLAANKPKADLGLKSASIGKPDGPPPMPGALALDPVVSATRGSALPSLAHSPWAPVVALGSPKQVVLYTTGELEFAGVLPFPEGLPCDLKFSRNGRLLIAGGGRGGKSGEVVVWDITTGERVITIGDQFDAVLAADLSADQQWLALGGPDRVVKVYRTKDGTLEHRIKKHTEWVTAVAFSPDGKFLATGDRNGGLSLWEAESGREMFTLTGHKAAIASIDWRADSELVLSASEDGTVKLWKASDGTSVRSITAHAGGALSARFAADGRVVSAGRDNKVQLWEPTGKPIRALAFTGELPNRVTFNDDGTRVIGSDWQGRVFVWDVKSGKALGELDALPPRLSDRVKKAAEKVVALKSEHQRASAAADKAELEANIADVVAQQARKAVAAAEQRVATANANLKSASAKAAAAESPHENGSPLTATAAEPGASVKNIATDLERARDNHASPATSTAAGVASAVATPDLAALREQLARAESALKQAKDDAMAKSKRATVVLKEAHGARATATQLAADLAAAQTSLAKWEAALARTPGQAVKRTATLRSVSER